MGNSSRGYSKARSEERDFQTASGTRNSFRRYLTSGKPKGDIGFLGGHAISKAEFGLNANPGYILLRSFRPGILWWINYQGLPTLRWHHTVLQTGTIDGFVPIGKVNGIVWNLVDIGVRFSQIRISSQNHHRHN